MALLPQLDEFLSEGFTPSLIHTTFFSELYDDFKQYVENGNEVMVGQFLDRMDKFPLDFLVALCCNALQSKSLSTLTKLFEGVFVAKRRFVDVLKGDVNDNVDDGDSDGSSDENSNGRIKVADDGDNNQDDGNDDDGNKDNNQDGGNDDDGNKDNNQDGGNDGDGNKDNNQDGGNDDDSDNESEVPQSVVVLRYRQTLMSQALESGFCKGIKYLFKNGIKIYSYHVNNVDFDDLDDSDDSNDDSVDDTMNDSFDDSMESEKLSKSDNVKANELFMTLFECVASQGDPKLLKHLISKYAGDKENVDQVLAKTPVSLDICFDSDQVDEAKSLECLKTLINIGVNINKVSSRLVNKLRTSPTPLMMAALLGKPKIFEYLIQNGADINHHDAFGQNVLHYAIASDVDMVACVDKLFAAGFKVEENKVDVKESPLHLAVEMGKISMARHLIDIKLDIHVIDSTGQNLLHELASLTKEEVCLDFAQYLIEHGVKLDTQDQSGETPLYKAIRNGNTALVKLMLDKGCKYDGLCPSKLNTPLMIACDMEEIDDTDDIEIVRLLMAAKCDVNLSNSYGVTALMKAADGRNKELVKLLIQNGADVNSIDSQEKYPSTYCLHKINSYQEDESYDVLVCLSEAGVDFHKQNKDNHLFFMALTAREYKSFDLLVGLIKNLDSVTKTDENVCHLLAKTQYYDFSKYDTLSIDCSLQVAKNENGSTPLMIAAFLLNKSYLQMVKIRGKHEINACNKKGHTALHLCIIGYRQMDIRPRNNQRSNYIECLEILISTGADVNIQDKSGKTALYMAAMVKDLVVLEMLVKAGADPDILEYSHEQTALQVLDLSTRYDDTVGCLKLFMTYGGETSWSLLYLDGYSVLDREFMCLNDHPDFTMHMINYLLAANYCTKNMQEPECRCCSSTIRQTSTLTLDEGIRLRKLLYLSGAQIENIEEMFNACVSELKPARTYDSDDEEENLEGSREDAGHKKINDYKHFYRGISLKSRCRRIIREKLGSFIKQKIEKLALPEIIENFLLLNDKGPVEEIAIPEQYFNWALTEKEKDKAQNGYINVENKDNANAAFWSLYEYSYLDE